MRPTYLIASLAAVAALAVPAAANLTAGAKAPGFTAKGAVAGKPITFTLSKQLAKGTLVVAYFFPAAFTGGCNAEAHAFAEAMPDFQKAGATVVGLTAAAKGDNGVGALTDDLTPLIKFSSEYCAGKFPVVAASPKIVADYDVRLTNKDGTPSMITNRTSYVIAPDGKILFVHSDMSAAEHISTTLAAVREYRKTHPYRAR